MTLLASIKAKVAKALNREKKIRAKWEAVMVDENPDALFMDGFDTAIIGVSHRCGQPALLVYSEARCLKVLMDRDGLSSEEAREHFDFNCKGGWMGENTPIIMQDLYEG